MYSTSISKIMKREWTLEIIEVEQENRPDPEYFTKKIDLTLIFLIFEEDYPITL